MADPETTRKLFTSWRAMNERLASKVGTLDDEALAMSSYCTGWTITKVLSHMGSGSEIFSRFFDAALGLGEAPKPEEFQEFWAEWDAKSPRETAAGWRERSAALLAQVESYDDEVLAGASLDLFGRVRDILDIAVMRLSEDALHGWDIAVMLDGDAEVDPDAVPWVVDLLGDMVGFAGKAVEPLLVSVHTTGPDRAFVLKVDDHVALRPANGSPAGGEPEVQLDLPAAAFVRLVFGRMDAAHTPEPVQATGIDLDQLRATFPGL
jgi:uncharacterized protein (TIGR03083 family)